MKPVLWALFGFLLIHVTIQASSNGTRGVQSPHKLMGGAGLGNERFQITLVFIGSSTCAASRSQPLRLAMNRARGLLQDVAVYYGAGLHSVAIAVASSSAQGLQFLEGFRAFDEIMVGGGFHSIGLDRYLIKTYPGPDMTPQVLVLWRDIGPEGWGIESEQLLIRLVGTSEIAEWVESGANLNIPTSEGS